MKPSIVGILLGASLLFAPLAHADTAAAPFGNPYTDTFQLWNSIAASIEYIAQETTATAESALSALQHLASASPQGNPPAAHATSSQQSASLAEAVASFESTSATTSTETASNATSDQTTNPQNVKSAEFASANSITSDNPTLLSTPAPAFDASVYVTQPELTAQLLQLSNSLAQKFSAAATSSIPQNVAADGNSEIPYAAENAINNLSNVTITNANLTASEIPDLSGTYLPLNGGTLSGNLVLTNATSTNLFASTASSTNLFAQTASLGALTLASPLTVASGGTSAATFGQGWIYSNGGTGALAASTSPTVNYLTATSTTATSTFAGNLSVAGNLNFNGSFLQNGSPFVGSQWTTSGSNIYYNTGLVGVGTTSPGSILSINGVGNFVANATSTLYDGLNITSGCFSIAGTCIGAGGGSSASSTLLTDNNTFSGNNVFTASTTFSNLINVNQASTSLATFGTIWDTGVSNTLLSVDQNGKVVATSTIGSGLISVPANSILAGNASGQLIASTSIGVNLLTGILPIANGGTDISSQTSNGVNYFDGTHITSGTGLTFNGTNLGIGTTSPYALLSLTAQNSSADATLFQISSSTFSGTGTTSLLSFNSTGQLTIGPNINSVSTSTQLSILAGTTTATRVGQGTLNQSGWGIYVQGRYAYLADGGSATNAFEVWDISNPASPVRVSSNTLNQEGNGIYVQGRYAYLTDYGTTNAFEVWDISNPALPVRVSQSTLNANGYGIYVQGRYAYITDNGTTNSFEVWDISNPAAPVRVSSNTLNHQGYGIYVQGRYAYITDYGTTNAFEVWDISNPAAPVRVSSNTLNQNGRNIYVQGRYAYLADVGGTTNAFEVWDISNPTSPVRVSSNTLNQQGENIYVQGRYAYITDTGTTNSFEVWDVSNPASPVRVAQNTLNASGRSVYVQGRYAYLADFGTTNAFEVWDLGGGYIQQLETGGLETGTLSVRNNLQALDGEFSGGLTVGNNLNVGGSFSLTASTFNATSTAQQNYSIFSLNTASSTSPLFTTLYNGDVGIGTTTPYSRLEVWGPDTTNVRRKRLQGWR